MSNPINVLSLVSYKFLPPKMGGQKGIAFFNRYLSKRINLICVSVKNNLQDTSEGYEIRNILENTQLRYLNLFYFFALKKIIKKEKITHLIIEHPYYGWLGALLKKFCKVKLIVHSHNIESLRFKSVKKWWWKILWHYEKWTYKRANLNFFINEDDKNYGIKNFKLNAAKCTTITYGFELEKIPSNQDKLAARKFICDTYGINTEEKILLFNGTLDYKPNLDAINIILKKINPLLINSEDFSYKIIICGSKLPIHYHELTSYKDRNIIYAGFVDDITIFFKGADIFVNPVIDGGGIKTKVVEALGYNLSVVSTKSGAIGIPEIITGSKMHIVSDNEWNNFANQIISIDIHASISEKFFDHFYWGKIVEKAANLILQC